MNVDCSEEEEEESFEVDLNGKAMQGSVRWGKL